MESLSFVDQVTLRPGVTFSTTDDSIDINYKKQGCTIESGVHTIEVNHLLNRLRTGVALPLDEKNGTHDVRLANDLIKHLDILGLIVKTDDRRKRGMSGDEVSRSIAYRVERLQTQQGNHHFAQLLLDQSAAPSQLIGYALEYYAFVRAAPRFLGSALLHDLPPAAWDHLKNLFVIEHDHDQLLAQSLKAIGITKEAADSYVPLASTWSLIASLGAFSRQHILSFLACLFLFEEHHPIFNEAFIEGCQRTGLPEAFWAPFIAHAEVNDEESHADITYDTLRHYSAISIEEVDVIKTNVLSVVEMQFWQSKQIVQMHASDQALQQRLFPKA